MTENFVFDISLYFQVKASTQFEAKEKAIEFLESLNFPKDFHSYDWDLNYVEKFPLTNQ